MLGCRRVFLVFFIFVFVCLFCFFVFAHVEVFNFIYVGMNTPDSKQGMQKVLTEMKKEQIQSR